MWLPAAETLVEVLRRCGDDLTRANVMKQVASLKNHWAEMLLNGMKTATAKSGVSPYRSAECLDFP